MRVPNAGLLLTSMLGYEVSCRCVLDHQPTSRYKVVKMKNQLLAYRCFNEFLGQHVPCYQQNITLGPDTQVALTHELCQWHVSLIIFWGIFLLALLFFRVSLFEIVVLRTGHCNLGLLSELTLLWMRAVVRQWKRSRFIRNVSLSLFVGT